MGLHIGAPAPDFTTDTSMGKFTFHDWIGRTWVFFFSHPGDFAPVRTTEIWRTTLLADQNRLPSPPTGYRAASSSSRPRSTTPRPRRRFRRAGPKCAPIFEP